MGILTKMRKLLPDRRKSWTQKVRIQGQTCYLTVGLYEDGSPGEIFMDVSKAGTFVRGMMGTCARTVSIALQCGAEVETVVYMLRDHNYPPHGAVEGSPNVRHCVSVMDWVASELEAEFLRPADKVTPGAGEGDVVPTLPPLPVHKGKVAGRISDPWRSGA